MGGDEDNTPCTDIGDGCSNVGRGGIPDVDDVLYDAAVFAVVGVVVVVVTTFDVPTVF